MSFFSELKRRNVLRAATFYAASAWLIVQVATQVFPFFDIENWVVRWIVIAAAIGFPIAMALSWFYELTPEGFKRDEEVAPEASIAPQTGKRLDRAIIVVLSIIIVLLIANNFVTHKDESTVVAAASGKSIAVLPFLDLSPGHDQGYFSDGMSEEILNALAQVKDLKVAGRTSSFYFKGRNEDLRTIGKVLGVANILEGSVRKQGDKVRITAQLIRVSDDTHLWSHDYDGDLGDVFKLQDDIAHAITTQLQVVLVGEQKVLLAPQTTKSVEAHQKYLQGKDYWHRRGFDNLQKAVASYKAAIAADPDYADAWAGLAQTWAILPEYYNGDSASDGPPPDTIAEALDAAEHALRLQPDSEGALLARAYIRGTKQFDWAGAETDFRTVLAKYPQDATAHQWYGEILNYQRRWPEAEAQFDQALAIDRLSAVGQHLKGYCLGLQGKPAAALPYFEEALRITPGFKFSAEWRPVMLVQLHRYDDAAYALAATTPERRQAISDLITGMREPSKSAAAAASIVAHAPDTDLLKPIMLSMLGRKDLAMNAVEGMFAHHAAFRATVFSASQLDALHDDPRFKDLMQQVNLPPRAAGASGTRP